MRRSLQFSIERTGSGSVAMQDVDHAMEEMLFRGGSLNCALLGVGDSVKANTSENRETP